MSVARVQRNQDHREPRSPGGAAVPLPPAEPHQPHLKPGAASEAGCPQPQQQLHLQDRESRSVSPRTRSEFIVLDAHVINYIY